MLNPYTTYNMLRAIQQMDPVSSFLRDTYAPTNPGRDIFHTKKVLVEIRDAERRRAPVIVPYSNGVPMSRLGSTMKELEPFKVGVSRPITIDDIEERGFGEALYTDLSPEARASIILMSDLNELDQMITRTEELMVADVLLNNACKMEAIGDDPDKPEPVEVRFYDGEENPATHTVGKAWSDPTATIIDDINDMKKMLTSRGLQATDFVCAPDVAQDIIRNEEIQRFLDIRRYELGQVAPSELGVGAYEVCRLNVYGTMIRVIGYDQTYVDTDGTVKQYIPEGMGFLTAPAALSTLYAAISQIEMDGEFRTWDGYARVPKYEFDTKRNVRTVSLASKPLPVPNNVNPSISVNTKGE